MIREAFLNLLFPPKCVLCGKLLEKDETDLCRSCRVDSPECRKNNLKFSFLDSWAAVWYYEGYIRKSLLRYKFGRARHYAPVYGRMLAMKLLNEYPEGFDILTWVPISQRRKWKRGFDQVQLIAQSTGQQLGTPAVSTLRKTRHTNPQSRLSDASHRRANILGAYAVPDPSIVAGKRILLLDDIITTGSTVSECAKTLLTAGAKEVFCAAIAAPHNKNNKRR